jgi:phosphoadenosine phosphosulfate reductase
LKILKGGGDLLVTTNRHTKEDLELWRDYEEIDSHKIVSDKKIDLAISEIKKASQEKSYISVSWGKDSIVVAHLCHLAGIKLPMVWIKESPMHNPYCKDVRDIFLNKYIFQYHEIVADYGTVGFSPFLDSKGDSIFFHSIADAVNKSFGRRITGIRNQESNKRLLRYMNYGHTTKNTSAPISLWKTWEVFSYLRKYDLPVHPNYAMLGGGRYDREYLRVDCLAGTQGTGIGRSEWEKEYYQDIVNKIRKNEFSYEKDAL